MQCDYCGREILGEPMAVEVLPEALSPLTDLPSGHLNFCNEDCFHAYMEEAGAASLPEEEQEEEWAAGVLAEDINAYR
jgi:ribosome-binding protein aMBF1 (putative translation factor)